MAMIDTTKGPLDPATLTFRQLTHQRANGVSVWDEWYQGPIADENLVKRNIAPRPYTIEERQARAKAEEEAGAPLGTITTETTPSA